MTSVTVADNAPGAESDLSAALSLGDVGIGGAQFRRRRRHWGAYIAFGWIAFVLWCAILADWLPLADPDANITPVTTPPFQSWPEFLGTDQLGRSVISRLVYGARVSLSVSLVAGAIGI